MVEMLDPEHHSRLSKYLAEVDVLAILGQRQC
jgi:hypothetical protein